MSDKVYVTDENLATFICPSCDRTRTTDVSRFMEIESAVRVRLKCPCGGVHSVVLERRKFYRKSTNIPGICMHRDNEGREIRSRMVVIDISRFGLRLRTTVPQPFRTGDALTVEFILDNRDRTFVSKETVIRSVRGEVVGVAYRSVDPGNAGDKAIGFYLMG